MFLGHEELGARPWRSFGVLARRRMSEQAASALRDLSIRLPSLSVLEGGFISVIGTLWGACLAVILETGLVISGVSAFWQLIVVGVVLLVAVALDRFTVRRRARARR
jgi:hypothetical protein